MAHFAHFIEFLYKYFTSSNLSNPALFLFSRFFLSRFTLIVYQALTVKPPCFCFHTILFVIQSEAKDLGNTNLSIPYTHSSKCLHPNPKISASISNSSA